MLLYALCAAVAAKNLYEKRKKQPQKSLFRQNKAGVKAKNMALQTKGLTLP
jgi:hypothetical protein